MNDELLRLGNPLLRAISEEVAIADIGNPFFIELVETLFKVMERTGGVGVAAPQIGQMYRVFVFGTGYTKRRKPTHPIDDSVLFNPSYEILDATPCDDREGCLSIHDLIGQVPRATAIRYSGYNQFGQLITKEANGLEARIVQHETDHLNGTLFIDRVTDTRSFAFYSELERIAAS